MKLNKLPLLLLSPTIAVAPMLSTSCSLFSDAAWKVYKEAKVELGTYGRFECTDIPKKMEKDTDLVLKFTNSHKYKEKLVYKDITLSNVYFRNKIGADVWTTYQQFPESSCTVVDNVITISKEFVNDILNQARGQTRYEPVLNICLRNLEISDEITWTDVGELSDDAEQAKAIFTVGDVLPMQINNVKHRVRIVDFNRYAYDTGKTATFVFQFVDLISDSSGNEIQMIWDNKISASFFVAMKYYFNYEYKNSVVADKVNGDVTNWVKAGLGSAASKMKYITKPMAYSSVTASAFDLFRSVEDYSIHTDTKAYCFLPSVSNIAASPGSSSAETAFFQMTGTQFKFYEITPNVEAPRSVNGNYVGSYWTDSPNVHEYNEAYYVSGSTWGTNNINNSSVTNGLAPCFCM